MGSSRSQHASPVNTSATSEDRQAQNQRQRELFNRAEVVQEFMKPLPVEINQVSLRVLLHGQHHEYGSSDTRQWSTSVPAPTHLIMCTKQRLQRIANAVPGLGPSSRVIDVGCGTGCLIPHLRARGVQDILAVDLSEVMLAELEKRHAPLPGSLGNNLGER